MAENLNLDVILQLATRGAQKSQQELDAVLKATRELSKTNLVTEKGVDSASKAYVRYSNSLKGAAGSTRDLTSHLPRLRYALYDVSTGLTATGLALTGISVAASAAAITMDRQFADVVRTTETYLDSTGAATDRLRGQFNDLFSTLPVSWSDLTDIGTLAGQLNVASDSVANFTSLVAKFAATTDVSVEQSATAFGRLSELLDVPASEFENLGSSILAVGVNSVATESQIIAISTQITSMAASAGFSADEVFGLSAALASLGTQPELSRGVITRLFTNINDAIREGGDSLEQFGRTAGMTGREFAEAWGENAAGTLLRLMERIGTQEGPAATKALNDLGITASRDVPTLLRLAQNSDVLAESLGTAAEGYANGTALSEQYGQVAQTVAEKLKVLWNNVQLLVAELGGANVALGPLLDGLTGLLQIATKLASNPFVQIGSGIAIALGAIVGATALVAAGLTRAVGGILAVRTAMAELNIQSISAAGGLRAFAAQLLGIQAGAAGATGTVRGLGIAMKSVLVSSGIGIALVAIGAAWEAIAQATRGATERADEYFSASGGSNFLHEAVVQDTAAFKENGQAISTYTTELKKAEDPRARANQAIRDWVGIQTDAAEATGVTTSALQDQTIAFGENAVAATRAALAQIEGIQKIANDPALQQAAQSIGFNIDDFIAAGLQGGDAMDEYIAGLQSKIREIVGDTATLQELSIDNGNILQFMTLIEEAGNNIAATSDAEREMAATNEFLGATAANAAGDVEDLTSSAFELFDAMFEGENAILATQNAIYALGESLGENGVMFDYYSAAGRENLGALMAVMQAMADESDGDAAVTAANLQALYNFILAQSPQAANALSLVKNAINSLGDTGPAAAPTVNFTSFFEGWGSGAERAAQRTKKATREARKEIKTLTDYANDLSSVWSRAFDIRFDPQSTMDDITSSFQDLRNQSTESAKRVEELREDIQGLNNDIRTLNNDISGLEQDKSLQQYFKTIADAYGDTLRSKEIGQNIRDLDEEILGKRGDIDRKKKEISGLTEEITIEEDKNSKSLTGNSEAAIRNREALRGLVQQYQDHIQSLANSGLTQDQLRAKTEQLRQDFINQATQLGFNRNELGLYEAAFDDVIVAINNVPRNITVNANVDPAIQALNEFQARADAAAQSAKDALDSVSDSAEGLGGQLDRVFNPNNLSGYDLALQNLQRRIDDTKLGLEKLLLEEQKNMLAPPDAAPWRPGFAGGGFTGRGGKYDPAGVVHRGEYVVRKELVNQRTGLPYADAFGRLTRGVEGRTGYAGGGYVGGTFSQGPIPSFGPMALQQLATALRPLVKIDSERIAQKTSLANANSTSLGAS